MLVVAGGTRVCKKELTVVTVGVEFIAVGQCSAPIPVRNCRSSWKGVSAVALKEQAGGGYLGFDPNRAPAGFFLADGHHAPLTGLHPDDLEALAMRGQPGYRPDGAPVEIRVQEEDALVLLIGPCGMGMRMTYGEYCMLLTQIQRGGLAAAEEASSGSLVTAGS